MLDIVSLQIKPTYTKIPPHIKILVNNQLLYEGLIKESKTFTTEVLIDNKLSIKIFKQGKTLKIVKNKQTQSITIEQVLLNAFSQHPDIYGQFSVKNNPYVNDHLLQTNQLALNGTWTLDIPVFRQPFVSHYAIYSDNIRDKFQNTEIACFGCSFTYGANLEYNESWPYYLDSKNFGLGGRTISDILGTALEYVQKFKCKKIIFLLPGPWRLQLYNDENNEYIVLRPGHEGVGKTKKYKNIIRQVAMYGESSLLLSGYVNDLLKTIEKISKYCEVFVSCYDKDFYEDISTFNRQNFMLLPFYERSEEYPCIDKEGHPGAMHNKIFADQIKGYVY